MDRADAWGLLTVFGLYFSTQISLLTLQSAGTARNGASTVWKHKLAQVMVPKLVPNAAGKAGPLRRCSLYNRGHGIHQRRWRDKPTNSQHLLDCRQCDV